MVKDKAVIRETNTLFPVFLKLEHLKLLIVGGGTVGLEKLHAVLLNSPATHITVVAQKFREEVRAMALQHENIQLITRAFEPDDIKDADLVIIAVNDRQISRSIWTEAKLKDKLVNVADTPELCDFYLSSVVRKGNLKIAVSTNGKSPTVAKRIKEILTDVIPGEMEDVLHNMQAIRGKLNGDFRERVVKLNELTKVLVDDRKDSWQTSEKHWKRIASYFLFAFFFMFVGHLVFSLIPIRDMLTVTANWMGNLGTDFYWMIAAGFLAQLVDGALGMGYGVTCTTVLLSIGVNLPVISGSIHTAEMFSSGISGYSHYKFGNVNKKLFKTLLIPGVLGAIGGAFLLSVFGDQYSGYIRPLLAAYTFFLGVKIISSAWRKNRNAQKTKRVGWLAGAGGFLDSFGGGGWGPLVTSTLISKGRSPKYVIGSVSITEFFVTLASAATFFTFLGISHWPVILGLIAGGSLAAPLAARLAGKLPLKTMFFCVGGLVIMWSLRIIVKTFI